MHLILNRGPWVALHCRSDNHHEWEKSQFAQYPGPFLTCEAVVAETCYLLARAGFDPAKALALIEKRVVRVAMWLGDDVAAIRALFQRYDNVPTSLADACLIRLAGGMDLLIAAHAMAEASAIITNNVREFLRVPGLALKEWAD